MSGSQGITKNLSGANASFNDKVCLICCHRIFIQLTGSILQGKPMELRLSNMIAAKGQFLGLVTSILIRNIVCISYSNQRCCQDFTGPKRNG